MAGKKNNSFSRRLPDVVTKELVFVLSQKRSYEFKPLFEVVHDNLRRRNAAHGGEELLRLRAYEKLHNLVYSGAVKKNGKLFTGNSAALDAMTANALSSGCRAWPVILTAGSSLKKRSSQTRSRANSSIGECG